MADKTIQCRDCSSTFVFTENEQAFYREKGFENEPQRCPECRAAKKAQSRGNNNRSGGGGYGRTERQMFDAVCSECGVRTKVPFEPSGDKPVYCRDCYQPRR